MKAVIQRVSFAEVTIDHTETRRIEQGFLVLLCVMKGDTIKQAEFLAQKIADLRVFSDEEDRMNRSLGDINGDVLVISNFTLSADCKKGRRPSFDQAASPAEANALYEEFVRLLREKPLHQVETGAFGADMQVHLNNDGPVTLVIDTAQIGK